MPQNKPVFDILKVPLAYNVCNQTLREILQLSGVSIAHVIMEPGSVSLLHEHNKMAEIYFIISGEGIITAGATALIMKPKSYCVLTAGTPHKLENTGSQRLEHFVFAVPPFNPDDIKMIEDTGKVPGEILEAKQNEGEPIEALDGALIWELLSRKERETMDVALALGQLQERRKAIPHRHEVSDEVYFVLSGSGYCRIDNKIHAIHPGFVIMIPRGTVHALGNPSAVRRLEILCLSSPAYRDGDFIKEQD